MKLKLKYFIRGLGIGILFTAIVMSISLQASRGKIIRDSALSKEEIIDKAKSYGLELESYNSAKEESSTDSTDAKSDTQVVVNNEDANDNSSKSNDATSSEKEDGDKALKDKDDSNKNDDGKVEDNKKAEEKDNNKTDDKSKDDSLVSIDYVKFSVESGMTAGSVSDALVEKGIIDDQKEFLTYLSEQGYAGKIQLGDYLIPVDATYKKIARIITRIDR